MGLYSTIIDRSDMPFQIFIGGRGLGKTYSALSDLCENATEEKPYILLRNTSSEVEALSGDMGNPFKPYNRNNNTQFDIQTSNKFGFIVDNTDEENPKKVGYILPLSTFSKIRGVDFSDVEVCIFDEMIPERHVHKISHIGEAFLHFYETVNRNREFEGRPPLRVYMLANAINLSNDILLSLGVVSIIADMKIKGRKRFTDKKRGIYIELMENAEFAERKSDTALYRMSGGTDFSEQALNNNFTTDDFTQIKQKVNINEYVPQFMYDCYTVYMHKSDRSLYICKKRASGVTALRQIDSDILYWRFAPQYRLAKLSRMVYYDDYTTKVVFDALTSRT